MELFKRKTVTEAWLAGVEHLNSQPRGEDFDVLLHVSEPTVLSIQDKAVYNQVDEFLKEHGAFGLHTVAETIFPLDEYLHGGAKGVFENYPPRIRTIRAGRDDGNWGTYAYRMLRQRDYEGTIFNPLKDMIEKIRNHGKYRASFEIGLGHPLEEDMPIYDPATDRKRLYGGPCLSHLSVKIHDGYVRFNATYRSHYYVRRLLGNLVGLGRLQYFIARETGLQVGGLTINSTFARLDSGSGEGSGGRWTKRDVEALIARCRTIYTAKPAAA